LGLTLDSTAAVAAERQGKNARQLLEAAAPESGDEGIAVSDTLCRSLTTASQRRYIRNAASADSVSFRVAHGRSHPAVTVPIALHAGQIDGQSHAKSMRIPLSDLLIGASALALGYSVGIANVRHFQLIPGLTSSSAEAGAPFPPYANFNSGPHRQEGCASPRHKPAALDGPWPL
jgi:predicted nucleic acid-binding protein